MVGKQQLKVTSMDFTTIEVRTDGPRGWLELNRPDKRNALSLTMLAELAAAGAAAVRLGPTVLRTSTAAAVALGALGVLTDRWATPSP